MTIRELTPAAHQLRTFPTLELTQCRTALKALGIPFDSHASLPTLCSLLNHARNMTPLSFEKISHSNSQISISNTTLIAHTRDGNVGIWDLSSQRLLQEIQPENPFFYKFAAAPDHSLIAISLSPTAVIRSYRLALYNTSGHLLRTIDIDCNSFQFDFLILKDAIFIYQDGWIKEYNLEGQLQQSLEIPYKLFDLPSQIFSFRGHSKNENFIEFASQHSSCLFNRQTGKILCLNSLKINPYITNAGRVLEGNFFSPYTRRLAVSPDERQAVVTKVTGEIALYNLMSFEEQRILAPRNRKASWQCTFSPSGRFVIGFKLEAEKGVECFIWDLDKNTPPISRATDPGLSGSFFRCFSSPSGAVVTVTTPTTGGADFRIWSYLPA